MNKMFTIMRETSTARFFIPVGLIFIIFGIAIFVINTKNQSYIKTEATVLNIELLEDAYNNIDEKQDEKTYKATIKYTVDGKEYTTTLENVPKYNIGDKTTIYYNPKDPSKITQTKSLILPIVIIVGGILFLTGGIISLINAIKRQKKMRNQERSWENG